MIVIRLERTDVGGLGKEKTQKDINLGSSQSEARCKVRCWTMILCAVLRCQAGDGNFITSSIYQRRVLSFSYGVLPGEKRV